MNSDPYTPGRGRPVSDYTPNEDQVRDAYVKFAHEDKCLHLDMAREDARRGIAKIKADALREAATELEDREHCYNDALSAAFVPGETGRGNVIQSYEAILEEPYEWLRERAVRTEEEA